MERLQKVIANSGYTSRRKAEALIENRKVKVNGKIITELGTKVDRSDTIEVEGNLLTTERKVYFVLNKPKNTISTVSDEHGRDTVMGCLTDIEERIYPVGRLDFDTTGVLLFTNDGDFTNKLIHPSSQVEKEYLARVKGIPGREAIATLNKGIMLEGIKTKSAYVKVMSVDKESDSASVKIILTEGRYHQVKKMFESVGYPVKKLTRVRFGCIHIDDMPKGSYRALKIHEVKTLMELSDTKIDEKKFVKKKMRRL